MILAQLENLEHDLDVLMSLTAAGGSRDELDYAVGVLLMAREVWRRASDFVREHSGSREESDVAGMAADEATREYLGVLEVRLEEQQRHMDEWEALVVMGECSPDDDDEQDEHDAEPRRLTASGSGPIAC